MNDPKVKQWITESLNRELGKDPETGEGANVEVLSYEIVDCPMNGKHIVLTQPRMDARRRFNRLPNPRWNRMVSKTDIFCP